MVEIDYEIVHRIYKVAVQGQTQVPQPQNVKVEEIHPEIEVGVATEAKEISGETKVTIERDGVVTQQVYGDQGQLTKQHGKIGRNDPCWCGKKKPDGTPVKYKHCHYPN